MMNRLIIIATILLTIVASAYAADPVVKATSKLKMPAIFSDHMVLQRELPVPVWGWAEPGEEVTVTIADQTVTAKAGADGKWKLELKPLTAVDSTEMVVKGKDQTITIKDVAVGEVWLATGQSNMSFPLSSDINYKKTLETATDPGLRLFSSPGVVSYTLLEDVNSKWVAASSVPNTVDRFSATGYYFGRELRKSLKVPIGIIQASVGGAPGSAYLSPEAMEASTDPGLKTSAANFRHNREIVIPWMNTVLAKYKADLAEAQKNKTPLPKYPGDIIPLPFDTNKPCLLYNGQLGPLKPYAVRGAIWNQGESSSSAKDYAVFNDALLTEWRKNFSNPELAFLFVQIPHQYPWFRETQLKIWQSTPRTAMVVINDTSTSTEGTHSKYKEIVGRRLALAARATIYGENIEYSGPVYDSVKFEGGQAIISFTHVGAGLAAKVPVAKDALTLTDADLGGDLTAPGGKLRGFIIAGADNKFVPAKAEIRGDTVVVSSPDVTNPAAVLYCWSVWPKIWEDTTLYNKDGLPAPPFRTDLKGSDKIPNVAGTTTATTATATAVVPKTAIPSVSDSPRHQALVKLAQAGGIDLMFLGDSITEFWQRPAGRTIWATNFAPLKAANFGISGHTTQNVLWRLQNGELEGIHPKVVVLLIGTNNISEKPVNIALGVKAIIAEIQKRSPGSRILLMGIFPRGAEATNASRAKITETNTILETYASPDDPTQVIYLDIGEKFLNADGSMNKDLMPDTLHPSEKGYQVWTDAILDTVKKMLQ